MQTLLSPCRIVFQVAGFPCTCATKTCAQGEAILTQLSGSFGWIKVHAVCT